MLMNLFRKKKEEKPKKTITKAVSRKAVRKAAVKRVVKKNVRKVTKKAVKKSPKKTIRTIEIIEIIDVAPESVFWLNGGESLKNLIELRDALESMGEEQFDFHTKRDGNDFANWIEGAIGHENLAKEIKKAKTKDASLKVIGKYVA